ncbi:MAG: ABC transporter ATP-binding protein [Comamonadaceae bacterium]|nr:ABC transporter ATP-binding protein [Comamonadaceae bacterium]
MGPDAGGTAAIEVAGFQKNYGTHPAVKGISFSVFRGEIFGLVGPNGAGKTTTIEMPGGIAASRRGRHPGSGARPLGEPAPTSRPHRGPAQESAIAQQIKVREALDLYRSFYPRTLDPDLLIERLGHRILRDTRFQHLSGGQKQRLFIALALIHDPEVLLLDELTTGLDPQGRRMIWERIQDLNRQGKTIVLTTHFMEEAERLCDRVLILDRGEILALDRPETPISRLAADHVVKVTVKGEFHLEWFEALPSVDRAEALKDRVTVGGRGDTSHSRRRRAADREEAQVLRSPDPPARSGGRVPASHGRGGSGERGKPMKALLKLTWTEARLFLREPQAFFFTLFLPLVLLFVYGGIYGNAPKLIYGGFGTVDVSVPAYTALIIATSGLILDPGDHRHLPRVRRAEAVQGHASPADDPAGRRCRRDLPDDGHRHAALSS